MISFITLTNLGYVDYTLNCLKSLENISHEMKPTCYCIGKESYNKLTEKNYKSVLIDDEKNTNFQVFRTGNWSNITIKKFNIIYENLLSNEYVLFTDGDIVYENGDFMNYLINNIGDNDILIQNDTQNDDSKDLLCSGFMFIKSNEKTLELFNPTKVIENENTVGWDDQVYINNIKEKLKYNTLPLHLFPNGLYFYRNCNNIKPFLIHFNFLFGHEKKDKMKYHSKWYLD